MSSGAFEGKALLIERLTDGSNGSLTRFYVCFVVLLLGAFFLTRHDPETTRQSNSVVISSFIISFVASLHCLLGCCNCS